MQFFILITLQQNYFFASFFGFFFSFECVTPFIYLKIILPTHHTIFFHTLIHIFCKTKNPHREFLFYCIYASGTSSVGVSIEEGSSIATSATASTTSSTIGVIISSIFLLCYVSNTLPYHIKVRKPIFTVQDIYVVHFSTHCSSSVAKSLFPRWARWGICKSSCAKRASVAPSNNFSAFFIFVYTKGGNPNSI